MMLALTVPSRTRPEVSYHLDIADGGATCECPGWRFTGEDWWRHQTNYFGDRLLTEAIHRLEVRR